ncbi:MAG: hypothetical protein AB4080_18370 [Trichodesmium sp.]
MSNQEGREMAHRPLGYYSASDDIAEKIDPNGYKPEISASTKEKIYQAIAADIPEIATTSDKNKKAIAKWVVNES